MTHEAHVLAAAAVGLVAAACGDSSNSNTATPSSATPSRPSPHRCLRVAGKAVGQLLRAPSIA
ncbi:hypothetical protein [Mycobacterium shigaense]|uniref:hypothetical protein n=1 Tax=Mycobacterium shigaense TaxID=722731 RepID=UPI001159456A|nr:hypothetical protein [Mycobacterium shigaense]MEA1123131.1 hypothetical protein [Mycobacterium shigaense]